MAEPITRPEELLAARLRTMLWVELTLEEEVLPKLREQTRSAELQVALDRHLLETHEHVDALRHVFLELGVHAEPEESAALRGLVREHEHLLKRLDEDDRLLTDLARASAAAAAEHLEIAAYHELLALAGSLGEEEVAAALRRILGQERFALEQIEHAVAKLLAEQVEAPHYPRP